MENSDKKILYLDMDGVLVDFDSAIEELHPGFKATTDDDLKHRIVDESVERLNRRIFYTAKPIHGAIDAFKELSKVYEVYLLSVPMWHVPESFQDKRLWVDEWLGAEAEKRLILTHRKDLNKGNYLVDDRIKHGVDAFEGEHIHFGTPQYPNWASVLKYLKEKDKW